jgi:hypothetical protein
MHLPSILKRLVASGCACRCVHLRGPSFFNEEPGECVVHWDHHPNLNEWLFFYADAVRTQEGWSLGELAGVLDHDDKYWFNQGVTFPPEVRPFKTCAWDVWWWDEVIGTVFGFGLDPTCSEPSPAKMLAAWDAKKDTVPLPPINQKHDMAIIAVAYVRPDDQSKDEPEKIWWRYTPHLCFSGCMADASAGGALDAGDYGCDDYYGGGTVTALENDEEFTIP